MSWQPTLWVEWYDAVLDLFLSGLAVNEIAEKLSRPRNSIRRLTNSKLFKEKYEEIVKAREKTHVDASVIMQNHKVEAIEHLLNLMKNAEKDSTKATITMWLLERFPEFATKGDKVVQNTNIYQSTKEDQERHTKALSDLDELQRVLARGNPHVVETDKNYNDYQSRKDTPDSGEYPETP